MERATRWLLFFSFLSIILEPEEILASDIACFKCSGVSCNDPFDPEEGEFCEGKACVKKAVSILGDLKTIRGCLDKAPEEFKCSNARTEVVKAAICSCDTDFCNQSTRINCSLRLLLILIFVSQMILSCSKWQ